MTQKEWTAIYRPTKKDIRQGMGLIVRSAFPGRWWIFYWVNGLLNGAALSAFGFAMTFGLLHLSGAETGGAPLALGLMLFGGGLFAMNHLVYRRLAAAYAAAPVMRGQRLTLTQRGIRLANGRSDTLVDWRDVSELATARGIMVAVMGNHGVIIPEHLFAAQGGDTGGLRETVQGWVRAAQNTDNAPGQA